MGRGDYLGELEHVVLLAVAALRDGAYGMAIRDELERTGGRELSVPTVYSALDRLERKGYLDSRTGEPTPERGGRARKLFSVTDAGRAELRRSRELLERMWRAAGAGPG